MQKWKSQLKESGTLAPKKRKETWRKIDPEKLRQFVAEHPDAYLREIAAEFGCAMFAVQKALKRLNISRKKTLIYRERCEHARLIFTRRIKRIAAKNLVYVDEAGINQYLLREYARAPRGQKVIGQVSGKKFKRTNIVAGLCRGRWVAPMQYEASTDSSLFEFWFEHCLLKETGCGKYIVLDNATFHRKARLTELAESKRCKIIFLPPYSPDLNPIEKRWAWLKQKLREILPGFDSLDTALWIAFQVV